MALNDPQWGNKNSGPPDLEEMLRKLNRKLAGVIGGRRGGGPAAGGPAGGAPGFGSTIGLIVAIVALIWIGSGFYIVDASQRGVVLRFGKYVETTQPGPRWHLPFPIESVEVVNLTQVRTVEVGYRGNKNNKMLQESLMLTDDENIIDIQFAVQYFLKDVSDYVFSNRAPEENVRLAAEAAIREVVGKNKMDFVLYEGRGPVETETGKLMQEILDRYKSGIQVSQVNLLNVQPPEQVQAAFDDAVKAGQDKERQKNEGQAYANNVVPLAKGGAARLMQEADGYRQSLIASAQGDASRFTQILAAYDKAPQVTRERMYIEAMQQILSSTTKVMIEQQKGGSLLYLPLDKLIQSAGRPEAATQTAQAAPKPEPEQPPAKTTPESDAAALRSGDTIFGRERGERP